MDLNGEVYQPFKNKEDELECVIKAKNGDKKAHDEICLRNLRYIHKLAKRYRREETDDLEEIINAGVVGLYEALKKFDTTSGNRFLTYAHWKIFEYIFEEANKLSFSPLFIPSNKKKEAIAIYRIVSELEKDLGREPDIDEVLAEMKNQGYKTTREFVVFITGKQHLPVIDIETNPLEMDDDG